MPPISNPDIQVFFNGLLALYQENADRFRVGVVRSHQAHSHNHRLCVKVIVKPNEWSRHEILLPAAVSSSPIYLEVDPPPTPPRKYRGGPIVRSSGGGDQFSFDWIVTLDGREFHDANLCANQSLNPSFYINTGEFYTVDKYPVLVERGQSRSFMHVAFTMGANIHIASPNTAKLKFRPGVGGAEQHLNLSESGMKYEVWVENVVPDRLSLPRDGSSDFDLHYSAYRNTPGGQFQVNGINPPVSPEHSKPSTTTDFGISVVYERPCIPIGLSQTPIPNGN